MRNPYIIVIEGLDGSGKETSSKALVDLLRSYGYKVKMVSFPMYDKWHSFLVRWFLKGKFGKSPYSVSPRIASLFYAIDRFFGFHGDIKADLNLERDISGEPFDFIIFDRYYTSNMLYQAAKAKDVKKGLRIAKFVEFLEHRLFKLPKPDRVFALTSTAEQSRDAMKNREFLDVNEKDIEYQEKVRKFFDILIAKYKWYTISTRKYDYPHEWNTVEHITSIMNAFIDYSEIRKIQ